MNNEERKGSGCSESSPRRKKGTPEDGGCNYGMIGSNDGTEIRGRTSRGSLVTTLVSG